MGCFSDTTYSSCVSQCDWLVKYPEVETDLDNLRMEKQRESHEAWVGYLGALLLVLVITRLSLSQLYINLTSSYATCSTLYLVILVT